MDESPAPDEDSHPSPPWSDQLDCTGAVSFRLIPKDDPKPLLLRDLVALFIEAAEQANAVPPREQFDPVPDDQGVPLRAILDQKVEEVKEKAAKAEPRATELKKRLEEHGPDANAAAREKLIRTVIELKRQFGIVVTARTDDAL